MSNSPSNFIFQFEAYIASTQEMMKDAEDVHIKKIYIIFSTLMSTTQYDLKCIFVNIYPNHTVFCQFAHT